LGRFFEPTPQGGHMAHQCGDICCWVSLIDDGTPRLRQHDDSQTVVFLLPKLRPTIFTAGNFCAMSLAIITSINQYPCRPIIVTCWIVCLYCAETRGAFLTPWLRSAPVEHSRDHHCGAHSWHLWPDSEMSGTMRWALNGHNGINNKVYF
jgi:hypothetical protein